MAHAVVVSVKQILKFARSRFQIPISELKPIYKQLCYVKSFFDKMISLEDNNMVEDLEKQIKDVVQNAQDLIEFHLSDLVHSGNEISISGLSRDLVKVDQQLASLVEMLKGMEGYLTVEQPSPAGVSNGRITKIARLADVDVSSRSDFGRNEKIVGLEHEKMMLKYWLLQDYDRLRVVPIVGMRGIGKTTLAKEVYLDPLIIDHFDIYLFVEVDLNYRLGEILLRLVRQLISEEVIADESELGLILHRYLFGRRYLIVLDDMWDIEAWNQLQMFFPDNENGSRIILTTRIIDVAHYVCEGENILYKRFLNSEESWELLCKMTFSDMEVCPPELVETGKAIVENLGGLPVAIVMIAKLLSVSQRTAGNWMAVAENTGSPFWDSTIRAVLNLSYTQLPQHLKACFLYLGLFPPNYSIPTYQLIRLWIAEGFIEHEPGKSLDKKAKDYLNDLISRSLVMVDQLSSSGRIKTCRIPRLLQDLCVSEARHQRIFHIVNEGTTEVTKDHRRLSIHSSDILPGVIKSVSGVRSLVLMLPHGQYEVPVFLRLRWLRVLHALSIQFRQFPDAVLKLVLLRYLAIAFDGELPPSISRLWNLEVMIIRPTRTINSSRFLPLEIWKLQKLRHLDCKGFDLPDPSTGEGNGGSHLLYLRKLQTLSGVSDRSCTKGVLARMPNLVNLVIRLEQTDDEDNDFTHLHRSGAAFGLILLPSGIIKLTLSGTLSCLPSLQYLKLQKSPFFHLFEVAKGDEFRALQFLSLEDMHIRYLEADETSFPRLRRLLIRHCYELEDIPAAFGNIPTLQLIEVDNCSLLLNESARRIQQEQQEGYGNYDLQVRIHSSSHRY